MLVCIDRIRQVDRQSRPQAALTDGWRRHGRTYDMVLYIHHLGAKIYGVKLDVRIYSVELLVKSPLHLRRVQNFGVSNDDVELR